MRTALCLLGGLALLTTSAAAAGDPKAGAQVFARCAVCHSDAKGGPNKIGPNLFGIVGSKAGTVPNFSFSNAMQKSGIVWTPENLDAYLKSPSTFVPGNRMTFVGVPNDQQRADVIAYLETLK